MSEFLKNTAGQIVKGHVSLLADGTDVTAGVAVSVVIDNGSASAGAGTLTYKAGDLWHYVPTQAETNGDALSFIFSKTGCKTDTVDIYTTTKRVSQLQDLSMQGVTEAMLLAPAGGTLGAASYSPFWYLGAVKYQLDPGGPIRVELQAVKGKTDYLPSGTAGAAGGVAIVGSAMTLAANQDVRNVTGSVGSVTNPVTVGTNNDKTNYQLASNQDVRNVTGTVNGQLDATAVQAAATAALNAYDPPTRSEATADKAEVIAAIPSVSTIASDSAAAKTAAQSADSKLTAVKAAVYDSASVSGDVITLSNGKTQTVTSGGRVTSV